MNPVTYEKDYYGVKVADRCDGTQTMKKAGAEKAPGNPSLLCLSRGVTWRNVNNATILLLCNSSSQEPVIINEVRSLFIQMMRKLLAELPDSYKWSSPGLPTCGSVLPCSAQGFCSRTARGFGVAQTDKRRL